MGAKGSQRMECHGSIPPQAGQETSHAISKNITPIAGRMFEDMRTPPFEQHRPKNQVQSNFARGWGGIVRSKSEPAVQQKERGQGTRYEQRVVKPGTQKEVVKMRLQNKPIQTIKAAPEQKEWIAQVTKRAHKSASMTRPAAPARHSLMHTIIMRLI